MFNVDMSITEHTPGYRWVTNKQDPTDPSKPPFVILSPGQSYQDALQKLYDSFQGKVIGKPAATPSCSVQQLEKMGMVGVYVVETGAGQTPKLDFDKLHKILKQEPKRDLFREACERQAKQTGVNTTIPNRHLMGGKP